MTKIQSIDDPQYVQAQYQQTANLSARIRLHQLFSANPYGWQRWLFDQLDFTGAARLLELGCGTGGLWLENLDRLPAGLEMILTDQSGEMVAQTRQQLAPHALRFKFETVDAQSIPYEDHTFDIVVANHMLYHVPDREKALAEITRVLRPGGVFMASTIGERHLQEISQLVSRFDAQLQSWGKLVADSFTLENGAAQLLSYFEKVSLRRYEDALIVTDAGLLAEYILSGRLELTPELRLRFIEFVHQELAANQGNMQITKDSGVFIARNS
jgi:ubiquinone/menaquinone biosynthesis C-methylase UbiE